MPSAFGMSDKKEHSRRFARQQDYDVSPRPWTVPDAGPPAQAAAEYTDAEFSELLLDGNAQDEAQDDAQAADGGGETQDEMSDGVADEAPTDGVADEMSDGHSSDEAQDEALATRTRMIRRQMAEVLQAADGVADEAPTTQTCQICNGEWCQPSDPCSGPKFPAFYWANRLGSLGIDDADVPQAFFDDGFRSLVQMIESNEVSVEECEVQFSFNHNVCEPASNCWVCAFCDAQGIGPREAARLCLRVLRNWDRSASARPR